MKELIVLLDGNIVGSIFQNSGRLKFSYADSWQSMAGAYPVSTSMPLLLKDHGHAKIEPFLWGLLPDLVERYRSTHE
jgi:serine/threonine-protein kinase HipA